MITLDSRPPVRIARPGTFPLPGMPGCTFTVGHDAVCDYPWQSLPDYVAVDIEGAGKEGRAKYDVKSVQIGTDDHALVADPRDMAQAHVIRQIVNSGRQLVFHNTPFDVPIMYVTGLLTLESVWNVWDTLVWARGAEPGEKIQKNLRAVTNRYLGTSVEDPLSAILSSLGWSKAKWYEQGDLNIPAYLHMAASDTIATARVWPLVRQAFLDRITTGHPFTRFGVTGGEAQRLVDREQVTNRPSLRRQCKGYLVDPEYLDAHQDKVGRDIAGLAAQIEEAGVRPGYSLSAVEYLAKIGDLPENHPRTKPSKTKPDGQLKSDKTTLESMNHPFVKLFLQHKQLEHDAAYLAKVMDNSIDGRIRPGTGKLAAATGRSSISGDAAFQQFTAVARGIILADDWEDAKRTRKHDVLDAHGEALPCTCDDPRGFVSLDWSQIEPTLAIYIAGDTDAIDFYEAGNKVYSYVESVGINVPYKQSKVIILGQMYGKGARRLASELDCSVDDAKNKIDLIWRALPETEKLVGRNGKLATIGDKFQKIFTLSGRIVPVPAGYWPCRTCEGAGTVTEDDGSTRTCWNRQCRGKGTYWQVATHKAVNFYVQGGAYDLLAETEYSIAEAGLSDALYLTMHDELVVDAAARHDIAQIMQQPNEVVAERLRLLAGRVPVLRTDMAHLGERWNKA